MKITNHVIQKSSTETRYMRYHPNDGIVWESVKTKANCYPSRYAAKQHMKLLDDMPEDAIIVEL